jgi:hypothetical protein
MKRIALLVLVSAMFTGCAQLETQVRRSMTSPADLAKEDCHTMGFVAGTQQFQNCVLSTSMNIRNARAQVAASEAANRAAMPRDVQCRQVGSYIHCSEM